MLRQKCVQDGCVDDANEGPGYKCEEPRPELVPEKHPGDYDRNQKKTRENGKSGTVSTSKKLPEAARYTDRELF